jgi:hypothetical protein
VGAPETRRRPPLEIADTRGGNSPVADMSAEVESSGISDRDVLAASLRFNTIVFSIIVGLFAGATLLALGLAAEYDRPHIGLAVVLMSIFLPGYGAGAARALVGLLWGFVLGALLGAGVYRVNARRVLDRIDDLMLAEGVEDEFPRAVLKLDGSSLGLAIGGLGALGLVATTNILVARGTAPQSVHARLLSEFLPGYTVSVTGSLIGAIELFILLYVLSRAFAAVYNGLARWRQHRSERAWPASRPDAAGE